MNVMLLTQAVYPTREKAEERLWPLLLSARRAGAPEVHLYGIGRPLNTDNWKEMQLDWQVEYLKSSATSGYTHVLYSDGADAIMLAPWDEIVEKYVGMGAPPILTAAFAGYGPEERPPYSCPHPGGYFAEIPAMVEALEGMYRLKRQTLNNCWHWHDAWEEGSFKPVLDSESAIFHIHNWNIDGIVEVGGRRRPQRYPNRYLPCILHYPGGYQDHVVWKDEQMLAICKRYGLPVPEGQ